MDNHQIPALADRYLIEVGKVYSFESVRADTTRRAPPCSNAVEHVMWCCNQVKLQFSAGETEKACALLGFVQGVLWLAGVYSIDDLRQHVLDARAGG